MKLCLSFESKNQDFRVSCYGDKESLKKIIECVQADNALITYCYLGDDKKEEKKEVKTEVQPDFEKEFTA